MNNKQIQELFFFIDEMKKNNWSNECILIEVQIFYKEPIRDQAIGLASLYLKYR